MVRAWFMDDDTVSDHRLEHHKCPQEFVDVNELSKSYGVEFFKFDPMNYEKDKQLTSIVKQRGYSYEDEIIVSKECLADFEKNLKSFFTEHLHDDEEVRFILDGTGFFDVRDSSERWIRIQVGSGDMVIIPAGIYHRFTLDTKNYIKAKRYFLNGPVFIPHNRPADDMECRKMYLQQMEKGFTTASVEN